MNHRIKRGRNGVLFATGLIFAYHEVFLAGIDRPSVLGLAALLMGAPGFLHYDEKRRDGDGH